MPVKSRHSRLGASAPAPPARQRIIAGARSHFFAHGFRGVTTEDLAEGLGMSKKTLYAHFPSKTALLESVILNKFQEVEADLDRIAQTRGSDFIQILQDLLACVQRHADEIQPAFVRDVRREAPELFKLVEKRRAELLQRHFGRAFAQGRRVGLIRKDIPVKWIIDILLGATQALVNPPKLAELGLTVRGGFAAVISVVLSGVLTDKGKELL
jgi:AcrR family transcriptional regulator